jgi:hypothetical protein
MPRGSDPAPPRAETPEGLHAMAARARRLARGIDERTTKELTALAEELEARAAALETAPQVVSHEDAVAVQQAEDRTGQH